MDVISVYRYPFVRPVNLMLDIESKLHHEY